MRVINQSFETITEYDLTTGRVVRAFAVKENAEPIDNVKKHAWADEDYEEVLMYIPNPIDSAKEPTANDVLNTMLGVV